jgi:hypothetical protein
MKRLSKQEKIDNAIKEIINQMFVIAGHSVTYDDIKGRKDAWYEDWTMTLEEYEVWKTWGTEYLRKNLKYTKRIAEKEMSMIGLMWGLKFKDFSVNL